MPRQTRLRILPQPWRPDGSLADHIEEKVDPYTGKTYFVDHFNKATTWVDPRDALRKPLRLEDCKRHELPYGWEMAIDPDVGVYYIDHNTWSTQLEDPRLYINPDRLSSHTSRTHLATVYRRLKEAEDRLLRFRENEGQRDFEDDAKLMEAIRDVEVLKKEIRRMKQQQRLRHLSMSQETVSSGTYLTEDRSREVGFYEKENDTQDANSGLYQFRKKYHDDYSEEHSKVKPLYPIEAC